MSGLRSELTSRHSEEKRVALEELASLKDSALRQAQQSWDSDRGKLVNKVLLGFCLLILFNKIISPQINELEHELKLLRQSASASLEQAKSSLDSQITSLRLEHIPNDPHLTDLCC